MLHGVIRMVLEYFRVDFRGAGPFGVLTLTQTISLSITAVYLFGTVYFYFKKDTAEEAGG